MERFLVFLHILGALSTGFYILLPFIAAKLPSWDGQSQSGAISIIRVLNRIAQFGLIVQLLTGGYLMTKGTYSIAWMVIVVVLLLAIAALGGIMGKPLRLALANIEQKQEITVYTGKIRALSMGLAVCLLIMAFFMVYRHII
ncbi:hypothetical protein [Paenibacillus campi]|uniref:hypothetical protein n=1 Tax=Paenibacillus campi TaxID=3106031 RepID=UPI002AFE8B8B|nr:hypothetical protein [Paenibacillus sp. SGZ-1009]